MKTMIIKVSLVLMVILFVASAAEAKYNRRHWKFNSYRASTNVGFYTGKICRIDIDHVVALKDAYKSGAKNWSRSQKRAFANDRHNHVPSCASVNRSKGSSAPKDFFRKASDGRGRDYRIVRKCEYLAIYTKVKKKYNLSFHHNDVGLLASCKRPSLSPK